ncbi:MULTISPECIES: helix-turn-helix domain-containing protein [Vibrio]|uniref:helix-turn-helix domain-containing protein n=1 Tax=Vibrio TaxID=662 RepID=UPI001BD363F7|nr:MULTISPECIES: AraC family transcriptional regulator [Vibrio]EHK9547450.1 helix-turn-helix transcriptional regulator [Vibrio alginolyticus]EHK9604002.1 helix-turn-helix transcriptional regulator [Vibrio alginolyticus]EIK0770762.1 helix-turn-helix transcriptional regulator [Vibrio alginolyticus]ELB2924841.1 helix-turn-helix transcriptional regulator [Vibrio alginolyticus]MBT0024834.1 helix-turn-helix transcriptional regulator [Vibrio alginolyticus]
MQEVTTKRTKIAKIALTQRLEATEKQWIVTQGQPCQTQLAEGKFLSYQYNDQIFVHGGRCLELIDSNIVSTAHASLLVTILLEGRLSFGYDDLQFDLDASDGPKGVVVNLLKPANFRRSLLKDNLINKINILVKPQWLEARLEQNCSHRAFFNSHQAFQQLELTQTLCELAETLTNIETPQEFQEKLEVESLIYQILHQATKQIPKNFSAKNSSIERHIDGRIEDIVSYIETHLDQELRLEKLASQFSMSVSNLQRRFKQSLNMTINGYIRFRRLEIARQHLERGLVTITEAAYEAGYHHPSNFTYAFKKAFGVPPHEVIKE